MWNEFFSDEWQRRKPPEPAVYRFLFSLERLFSESPLRLWDLGCGGGRHAVLMARLGHRVYASDITLRAVELTRRSLEESNLRAEVMSSDMTICPWPKVTFHGVISWDVLNHNTLGNIQRAIDEINRRLVAGGLFMGTLKSTKADSYGMGKEIEPNTFVHVSGSERGIPHHYFDEREIRELFEGWELISVAEQVVTYIERGEDFLEVNPFPYTTWGVLVRK